MRIRSLVVLAAVFAGVSAPSHAQVTSEQRIPVRKESRGDLAKRDSIDKALRDSLALLQAQNDSLERANQAYRDSVNRVVAAFRDSVAAAEAAERARLDSIARADSVRHSAALAAAATAAIPVALARRGFYFGVAGGTSSPVGDWEGPFSVGFNITVPFGWQQQGNRFGVRGDLSYDLHGGEYFAAGTPLPPVVDYPQPIFVNADIAVQDVAIWSGNLDATFDLGQWGDANPGALYVLGGIGVHFVDTRTVDVFPVGTNPSQTLEAGSDTRFGFNFGAGLQFGIGRSALFLESRWFTADLSPTNASWVPVILGIKFY